MTRKGPGEATEGPTSSSHSGPVLVRKLGRQTRESWHGVPTCQLRDVGEAEPVGVVAAAPQDFADLALAEEEVHHYSVKILGQPGRHGRKGATRGISE